MLFHLHILKVFQVEGGDPLQDNLEIHSVEWLFKQQVIINECRRKDIHTTVHVIEERSSELFIQLENDFVIAILCVFLGVKGDSVVVDHVPVVQGELELVCNQI